MKSLEFAKLSLKVFDDIVLKNKAYVDMILSDAFTHKTYYMGMVDEKNKVNFYDGKIRVVDPAAKSLPSLSLKNISTILRNMSSHGHISNSLSSRM